MDRARLCGLLRMGLQLAAGVLIAAVVVAIALARGRPRLAARAHARNGNKLPGGRIAAAIALDPKLPPRQQPVGAPAWLGWQM